MAAIEKESLDQTGLRSDVVTLYQGGQYHLYRYKKYTDVRLVFAPEEADRLLRRRPGQLRVPALRPRHLLLPRLRERQAGQDRALPEVEPSRGRRTSELVFVSGHPGRTDRLRTVAELEYLRDLAISARLGAAQPPGGAARRLQRAAATRTPAAPGTTCSASRNSRKARDGGLAGLLDPELMGRKKAAEQTVSAQPSPRTRL